MDMNIELNNEQAETLIKVLLEAYSNKDMQYQFNESYIEILDGVIEAKREKIKELEGKLKSTRPKKVKTKAKAELPAPVVTRGRGRPKKAA